MGKKGSLGRKVLALQLLIVLGLLAAVAAVSVAQSSETFRRTEGRKLLSIAESVAANPSVGQTLSVPAAAHDVAPFAENARALSGVTAVLIADRDGRVLTSPDPDEVGRPLPLAESARLDGRAWVGEIGDDITARVPVLNEHQQIVGYVVAEQARPSVWQMLTESPADMLIVLGIATSLGAAASVWLAWWVKKQTLGLEPGEIVGLVEHREAMLHGIKEGVVGLDQQHRVTLINDQAATLLSLPADAVGRHVEELDLNERLVDVLTGRAEGADQIVLRRGRVLVMNRMPIKRDGVPIGSVVTLRDHTELEHLRDQLDVTRTTTETLRAQAHEFSNTLHTIAGLIELGEYDDVKRFVTRLSDARGQLQAEVTGKVRNSAVAALLIAKASQAAEQGVALRLTPETELGDVDEQLAADLVTVLGNLIDNALDVFRGHPAPDQSIEVELRTVDGRVVVRVRDTGPGVAPDIAREVFRHGFTTKVAEQGGQRGLGLAITRQTCRRRGGTVDVSNANGAVFTAQLPIAPGVPA
ncbi:MULTISPECIES: sensor histidine kinase [Thermocrispum]|uniref:histidine kinase n=2 Tax=Thermocrispum agreste TaxID=37925 RepID=A0ABD6FFZ3_9PSEU|nr:MULTISPECIES: sensor histidine kinase [Thermocrispum]